MDRYRTINGIKFRVGVKSQFRMFRAADKSKDKAYIAVDYDYIGRDGNTQLSKGYASFKNWTMFLDKYYYPRHAPFWHCYELIREERPCKVHFDLDWAPALYSENEMAKLISEFVIKIWEKEFDEILDQRHIWTLGASTAAKGSLHVTIGGYYVVKNEILKEWIRGMTTKYAGRELAAAIDWKIYTKNRLWRLPYSRKMGGTSGMLTPRESVDVECYLVTNLTGKEKKLEL